MRNRMRVQVPVRSLCASLALMLLFFVPRPAAAQEGPPAEVRQAVDAIVNVLAATDAASISRFAEEHLTPAYRDSFGPGELVRHFQALREAARGTTSNRSLRRDDDDLLLTLEGERRATFRLLLTPSAAIAKLELAPNPPEEPLVEGPPLTWDTLGPALDEAARQGFAGAVIAVHDGQPLLQKAYGLADRESGRRNRLDTVFCIGSMPIDFTTTAVRLLVERGKLRLEDPISRFLDAVPADKRAITIGQLLSGASGLPDFHHRPEKDWDFDLAALDRDQALARILGRPLLFAPGSSRRHSHSAFVLLALLIEKATGQPYPEFLRHEVFEPAGMSRTGFYGESLDLDERDFASGYGASAVGLPNIPPNWGPTSWLVMGSGGMASTVTDMLRYYQALDGGQILHTPRTGPTAAIGGSDRGFLFLHLADGKGNRVLLATNVGDDQPSVRGLVQRLRRLVLGDAPPGGPAKENVSRD